MADNRYSNGKIYRLVNNVDNEFYVGSTCTSLAKRLYQHKQMATKKASRRVYAHLNSIGWSNVSIVLVEAYPCDSKMELERRERYFIDEMKASLNKMHPTRTRTEYRMENIEVVKEKDKERQRKRREENRDAINARRRVNREAKKDIVNARMREYYAENKETILANKKAWCEANKEKILEKGRDYYHKNKEVLNAKKRERRAQKKAEQQQ